MKTRSTVDLRTSAAYIARHKFVSFTSPSSWTRVVQDAVGGSYDLSASVAQTWYSANFHFVISLARTRRYRRPLWFMDSARFQLLEYAISRCQNFLPAFSKRFSTLVLDFIISASWRPTYYWRSRVFCTHFDGHYSIRFSWLLLPLFPWFKKRVFLYFLS